MYTGYSTDGPLVLLADDARLPRATSGAGWCCRRTNKDAALFPDRFGGRYALLHRPMAGSTGTGAGIWISSSPDLVHWGDHRRLLGARGRRLLGVAQDRGSGRRRYSPPTGWLASLPRRPRDRGRRDLPRRARAARPRAARARPRPGPPTGCSAPQAPYERVGDVGNVVFPCGWILGDDGDTLRVYYGAADTSVCVATASLAALLAHLR